MARFARFLISGLILAAGISPIAAPAQQQAAPETNLDKLTSEWYALANSLEGRVTRMLPCDPRVRTAIDEVSRASSARTAALNGYWQSRSAQSKAQVEVLHKLQSSLIDDPAEWKTDAVDAQQEQAAAEGMAAELAASATRRPALSAAVTPLNVVNRQSADLAKLAADRESSGAALSPAILDVLAAAEARQTAIEAAQKTAAAESARWTAYYANRLARAQTECAITGQAPRPAPRPAPPSAPPPAPAPAPAKPPAGRNQP